MLVDADILLYAVDEASPFHDRARPWNGAALDGVRRVAMPWLSLAAFVRIVTHPRALAKPLTPAEAWEHIDAWLAAPVVWSPEPGRTHGPTSRRLTVEHDLRANLVSDAVLAALCIEHGLTIVSADAEVSRFPELVWVNPLSR